jgi:hypothetical protein
MSELNTHFKPYNSLNFSGGVQFKEYDFETTSLRLMNGETVTATNAYAALAECSHRQLLADTELL